MVTSEVVIDRLNGVTRRIRERHTDINGKIYIRSYDCAIDADVNALLAQHASDIDAQLKDSEVEKFKDDVKNGINPFETRTLTFNTRAEILKPILDDALSEPATSPIVLNGLPYLVNVTDDELMALYGQDQAWVDDVRLKANDLLSSKTSLDGYVPILGVS